MSAPADIAAIRRRLAAATPGPWHRVSWDDCPDPAYTDRIIGARAEDGGVIFVGDTNTSADADLVAHAPADLAALAARVAAMDADLATRRAYCPGCASEVRAVDEDRCCQTCGEDAAIIADQMSLELVRDCVAALKAENAALRATLAERIP